MLESIIELIIYGVFDKLRRLVLSIFRGIGSVILSLFSLFKISPKEHYYTDSFDKKVGTFWLGLVFVVVISVLGWFIF